jgi:glycosyltransferase involved in cell wall biosynthesis
VTVVGIVARYSPLKGYETFLRMARELLAFGGDIRFVMVGTNIVRENIRLLEQIYELGLQDHCLLLGEQSEVEKIMNGLDVLVCPSVSESFGLVAVEALACRVPVVCSDIEVFKSIVGDEFRSPIGDHHTFSAHVYRLITTTKDERLRMGNNDRARMMLGYNVCSMIDEYKKVYRELSMCSPIKTRSSQKSCDVNK